jgi:hypothetical protein
MEKYYPAAAIKTPVLYDQMIGGRFSGLYNSAAYQNTCAVRMSYALNRSGLKLGPPPSAGGSIQGGDGYVYWIRVSDLKPYLVKQFKGADEELRLPVIPPTLLGDMGAMGALYKERVRLAKAWLDTTLANRKGIVVFEVSGWGDASGHFTLWNGSTRTLAYAESHDDPESNRYYFWLTSQTERSDGKKILIQVVEVKFWELK